jgi:hypothetical protein
LFESYLWTTLALVRPGRWRGFGLAGWSVPHGLIMLNRSAAGLAAPDRAFTIGVHAMIPKAQFDEELRRGIHVV